jgi:hypothetical protein
MVTSPVAGLQIVASLTASVSVGAAFTVTVGSSVNATAEQPLIEAKTL